MGEKQQAAATLRMARQELEDLYLGVPDDSVDLTFKDLASSSSSLPAPAATSSSRLPPVNAIAAVDHDAHHHERSKQPSPGALPRSSSNIFTYRPLADHHQDAGGASGGGALLLHLTPSPPAAPAPPTAARFLDNIDEDDDGGYGGDQYHYAGGRRPRRSHVAHDAGTAGGGRDRRAAAAAAHDHYRRRPGIPHSNICALCNTYVYFFRHRCLVCGRVYCRRCVAAGMADMAEGRKCVDCLGRRYSHRYIHRAGDTGGCGYLCCFWGWGYYPNAKAVTAQELIWAEKGPAPRRRPRPPPGSSSYSDGGYYSSTNNSASMSMVMNSDSSIAMAKMNGGGGGMPASASSSFVASFPHNPHAFPL